MRLNDLIPVPIFASRRGGTLTLGFLLAGAAHPARLMGTTLVFQEGQNGYVGCIDTTLSENAPGTSLGNSQSIGWDGDEPADTGRDDFALIRFDNIFGLGANQIPPGSQITSATLTYTVFNSGASGALHESLVDWMESVTYNTFGAGPGVQIEDYGQRVGAAGGATITQHVNATCSLIRWLDDPSSNHGWIVLPSGTDGVDVRSSEYTAAFSQRPRLTVVINEGAPVANLVRRPYLQRSSPTSITVVWRTDVCTDSRVRFGDAPGNMVQQVTDGAPKIDHVITLSGLAPHTRYYYEVGSTTLALAGNDAAHTFVTPPNSGTPSPFTAWIVGDSGTGTTSQMQVRDAMLAETGGDPPDIYLHVGDMAYENGTDAEFTTRFFAPYEAILRQTVCWPAIGNHEGASSSSATETGPYYESYVLPAAAEAGGVPSGTEAYYSFDYANAHFICLDSHDSDRAPGSPMLQWLAEDLASTDQEWLVAFWHHPPYSKGSHDSDNVGDSGGRMRDMRENVLPMLEAAGVDLVLAGHSHIYERSYLVDGAYDTPTIAAGHILDPGDGQTAGDGAYLKAAGLNARMGAVYVVAGHGGRTLGGEGGHPLMFCTELAYGSCLLAVDGNVLSVRNLRSDGVISDQFTIVKGAASGDYNGDGVVNLTDYAHYPECMSGPTSAPDPDPPATELRCLSAFDLDLDGNVDLADFAAMTP